MDDLLLLHSPAERKGSGTADLLPIGTKIFPSKPCLSRKLWSIAISVTLVCFILAVAGLHEANTSNGEVGGALLAVAVLAMGSVFAVMWVLRANLRRAHAEMVENGSWREGLLLFPMTGDMVVSLTSLYGKQEFCVHRDAITSIDLFHRSCNPRESWEPQAIIRIHYMGYGQGSNDTFDLNASRLTDSPEAVLEALHDFSSNL